MPKAPAVTMDQLGALIDAFTTVNAVMFNALASDRQSDAALQLLDLIATMSDSKDPLDWLRADVAKLTADAIRKLRGDGEGSDRIGLAAMT
ncbi:hypothetical protein [Xanthomonas oryzae]|uniref:hypothetical protein n=1 Tax=Xanthomonas oryzae TaxID=347 RepID=UPI002DF12E9A|nr:hypothetical protein [Xanthomonas oryzae pv. oryzicola]